jgi:hypothetical protein
VAHKYDYLVMERDYMSRSPEPSVRQVALDNGVPAGSLSAAQTYAREHDWHGKWLRLHDRTQAVVEERLADALALNQLREVDVRNDAVELIAKAIASASAGLDEMHYVKEHDDKGQEIWVERARHPATIPQVTTLLDKLAVVFTGAAPTGGEGGSGGELSSGIAGLLKAAGDGGVDLLVGIAGAARRGAGELEPRRVGSGTGSNAAAAGED